MTPTDRKQAEKSRKALQDYLELEWRRYPGYVKTFEENTYDELIEKLRQNSGSILYASKRIGYVSRIVDAIDQAYNEATDEVKRLVRVRYWGEFDDKAKWQPIAEKAGMTMHRAVRMNRALMHRTADLLGYVWDWREVRR